MTLCSTRGTYSSHVKAALAIPVANTCINLWIIIIIIITLHLLVPSSNGMQFCFILLSQKNSHDLILGYTRISILLSYDYFFECLDCLYLDTSVLCTLTAKIVSTSKYVYEYLHSQQNIKI